MKSIEIGKAYVKRSALTGKARSVLATEIRGERIVCIAEDNGKTLIVQRCRLHAASIVSTDQHTAKPSTELEARLDELLAKFTTGSRPEARSNG
jgi:hypothetical protein